MRRTFQNLTDKGSKWIRRITTGNSASGPRGNEQDKQRREGGPGTRFRVTRLDLRGLTQGPTRVGELDMSEMGLGETVTEDDTEQEAVSN